MLDFGNIVIQAEVVTLVGILVAMGYFYIKLGLFQLERKPKAPKGAKGTKK